MRYFIILLVLIGFFSSANAIQYQSSETDKSVNSENNIHVIPEILWDIHEVILDGTIVEYDNNTWTYHIKINHVFKGSLNFDLISAEGFDVWNYFEKGDSALFYLYDISPVSTNYKYKITDYSVKTSPVCDARSLIQISPILPNDPNRIVRGHPNIPADWEDPCVPDYFSYDPDFFNFREVIAPLKQLKHKIPIEKIRCYDDKVLLFRNSNGSPACVNQETKEKLIQRGWAISDPLIDVGQVDADTSQEQTIILNDGIDDYDWGTSFNPIYKKIILGKNGTITWFNAKQEPVHIQSDEQLFDEIIQPQESFSFTYDSIGIHRYNDPINWKRGTIFVSTEDIESSNLHPAKLLEKNPDDIAKEIMLTAINDDEITKTRLDNTIINAYVTKRGADIIVPESLCIMCTLSGFSSIEYRYGIAALYYPQSADDALDFAKRFMTDIGYKMDGTEWIESVDYGSYVQVKIQQRVQGWIVPSQFVSFTFFKDNTTISIGRWYDDVSAYQFSLSQNDAKEIAKKYMEKEVDSNLTLKEYKYNLEDIGDAQVIISYDKPLYVIPVGFKSTLQQEFNNGHCGNPEYFGAMVMVEGKTGAVIGWDYPGCE